VGVTYTGTPDTLLINLYRIELLKKLMPMTHFPQTIAP